ncbi:uncharacterized protein LOC122539537 isoform X2 [Chiloscyllium plagiosum]|uniref:uncharacterized protein LOC122539537 isoform X2 n=1 Tax=Chiloscyllium plagiosum TaxID=36176 RepID=UPI001CB7FB27|nr:uncharacterized protein LOC122539537 isoform X2 [Chiloscyllium plagiosum]
MISLSLYLTLVLTLRLGFLHLPSIPALLELKSIPWCVMKRVTGVGSAQRDSAGVPAIFLTLFDSQPELPGGSLSPSVTPASSELPSLSTLKKTRVPSDSTAHPVTGTPTAGLPPSSWNESSSSRAPFGSSSTAKNLVLVLLLVIAMLVLISLIVLRFKCRNYRKQKREAKDITSHQSTADRDPVTLISVRMTDTDTGSTINKEFL